MKFLEELPSYAVFAERQPCDARNIDVLIGRGIRRRREKLRWKLTRLALHVRMTFDRLNEIEGGRARPTPAELYDIAVALDVPASSFFMDILRQTEAPTTIM
jgi:transcriptional regulator with XRE-family HTH domain